MVGGFPPRRTPPKRVAEVPSPTADADGHDEDGRLIITKPLTPAPRPAPTFARALPPMPGTLPRPAPVVPPVKPAAAAAVAKRPPPPPPVPKADAGPWRPRKAPPGYVPPLDPNDIPY